MTDEILQKENDDDKVFVEGEHKRMNNSRVSKDIVLIEIEKINIDAIDAEIRSFRQEHWSEVH